MSNLINIDLSQSSSNAHQNGYVWLVGAGPGNADLLTVKAYKALQIADVVLFDSLVDESVLALIPNAAQTEYVGKRCGQHSMPQGDICQRIVHHALQGKKVVRLKGGDPAIFARTHEETQALEINQIPYSIVPGITSASGASAYSGIPLTQRDCAQSVTLTTASLQCPENEPDWQNLVSMSQQQTLVFYMGLGRIDQIATRLLTHGIAPDFPIAVIDRACTAQQTIIKSIVSKIAMQVSKSQIKGPAIIICGEVVKHQQKVSEIALHNSPEAISHMCVSKDLHKVDIAI